MLTFSFESSTFGVSKLVRSGPVSIVLVLGGSEIWRVGLGLVTKKWSRGRICRRLHQITLDDRSVTRCTNETTSVIIIIIIIIVIIVIITSSRARVYETSLRKLIGTHHDASL